MSLEELKEKTSALQYNLGPKDQVIRHFLKEILIEAWKESEYENRLNALIRHFNALKSHLFGGFGALIYLALADAAAELGKNSSPAFAEKVTLELEICARDAFRRVTGRNLDQDLKSN